VAAGRCAPKPTGSVLEMASVAGMATTDVPVPQLDRFFSVDVYLGATSVILPGPIPRGCSRPSSARSQQAVQPAHRLDLAAAASRLRPP
jgi:hypothetical protein